jgi:hypothetical protein
MQRLVEARAPHDLCNANENLDPTSFASPHEFCMPSAAILAASRGRFGVREAALPKVASTPHSISNTSPLDCWRSNFDVMHGWVWQGRQVEMLQCSISGPRARMRAIPKLFSLRGFSELAVWRLTTCATPTKALQTSVRKPASAQGFAFSNEFSCRFGVVKCCTAANPREGLDERHPLRLFHGSSDSALSISLSASDQSFQSAEALSRGRTSAECLRTDDGSPPSARRRCGRTPRPGGSVHRL